MLLGLDLHISAIDLSLRLAMVVALAALGAFIIRRGLGARIAEEAPTLDGLSVVVLMVFAIPLMDGVVGQAQAQPLKLAGFVAGAFAGMLLNNFVVAARLPAVPRPARLAHRGYCSCGRNNALLMAVLPASADPEIFLFIAAVQFPIYLIPAVLQPALSPPAAVRPA